MSNPNQFIEDMTIAFAMYVDGESMTAQQGIDLAERLSGDIELAADERRYQDNVVQDADDEVGL